MRIAFRLLSTALAVAAAMHAGMAVAKRPATVLLISDQSLVESWQPFADWKTRQGKATKIVSVQAIEKRYGGDDIQQKIRKCVLEHVAKHGTRWVILGGDSSPNGGGLVPDRDTHHPRFRYRNIPTDVYYTSRKSWDTNGDGVYGRWSDDRADVQYVHPQASMGRIPVRTAEDVKAYTAKVIGYEARYPQTKFSRTMAYTCPERMAYPKLNTSRAVLADGWPSGEMIQFFGHKTPWDKDRAGDHELSPANWAKMINGKSVGKLHIHGHGLLPVWVLENSQQVDRKTIGSLKNADAYPVITTVSCFTGHYDAKHDPSITEMMLRRPAAGAIAIVAPSREGVPVFSNPADFRKMITEGKMDGTTRLLTSFWKCGLENNLTIGESLAAAKGKMSGEAAKDAGYHWCLCELNLLGDPTLDIRAGTLTTPALNHPKNVATGKQTVTIQVGTAGATVCLWKGDEVYEVVKANAKGTAVIEIDPKSAGSILVTASGSSLNTVTGKIQVN